jgi:hypothetical protein
MEVNELVFLGLGQEVIGPRNRRAEFQFLC